MVAFPLLLFGVLAFTVPRADPLPGDIVSAMEDAEYGQARRLIDRLVRRPTLATERKVVLYAAHATCDVSLGDDAAAQQSFQKLLTLAPAYQPDPNRTSPKVLEVFELVRARMAEQGALDQAFGPEFQPLEDVAAGDKVEVAVAFKAAPAAALVRAFVRYRRVGDLGFESAELQRTGDAAAFSGAIPATFLQTSDEELAVQYFVDATGSDGARLAGVGTADLPLQFRVLSRARAFAAPAGSRGGAGSDRALKVLGVVMPIVFGVFAVTVVGVVTAGILGLTALEPGASHYFLRWRRDE